jgi:hypothetical protein
VRGRRPTLSGLHMGTHNLAIITRLGHNRREYQEDVPRPGLKSPHENRMRNSSVLAGLKTRSPGLKRLRKNSLDEGHGFSRAVTNHGLLRLGSRLRVSDYLAGGGCREVVDRALFSVALSIALLRGHRVVVGGFRA